MKQIIFSGDKYKMNWLREDFEYAQVSCTEQLEIKVENRQEGDILTTAITFRNSGSKPVFTTRDTIGIRFPLEDKYESSDICIPCRCNTHIFCGGDVSYILALRMGGEAPHLGMALTEGSLDCYSVERDLEKKSNDRGCFILHPSPMELAPGETAQISWKIFPHEGKEDFVGRLKEISRFIQVEADQYVAFTGEQGCITITPVFAAACVTVNGNELKPSGDGSWKLEYCFPESGEHIFDIWADGVHTWCRILIQEPLLELAGKRCRFIMEHQQYKGKFSHLAGAYLSYDNEEKHIYYSSTYDYNGGRERVGMGILMARYLRLVCRKESGSEGNIISAGEANTTMDQKALHDSLKKYIEFIRREILIQKTGEICNEMEHDNSYERLYNFPWFVTFFVEVYELYGNRDMLEDAFRILEDYYRRGGENFYPIELPVLALDKALEKEGMEAERTAARNWFVKHGTQLARTGIQYPKSEVNYEQSIVAPGADVLLQVYVLTKDIKFLEAGEIQMKVLEQFNGQQPDYHLYETAIRHWDGYWFGKKKLFGDTFPHYWSGLSGNVYALYASINNNEKYRKMAQASLRGVLSLFFRDGSASCAYVYPHRVNGQEADLFDPYANDQDWGLYFNLRYYC